MINMAILKCWSKRKSSTFNPLFKQDESQVEVGIAKEIDSGKWEVDVFHPKRSLKKDFHKQFKRKSQALKFSKSYMKKHDRCRL